ncbi:aprataxin-like protein isoform X1 [Anastrepha ludens]|uniref:aprataxin-like protein isoform X1 n=1 Tax=Anastrepha ludens TaxID=28586 RepID=UPI0023B050A6|nr:aprataxin-like protein isoform X1 [Anastrepha ludens]
MTNSIGKGWAAGLVSAIKDPKNCIISSEDAVVIRDKYPKAQHHYLVLPKADIADIFHLTLSHLPLLEELYLLAQNVIEVKRCVMDDFKIGFHAQPSMQRLHLHVISKDFVSDCLKTKKHWTSFNTELFLPYQDVTTRLKADGCIKRLTKEKIQQLTTCALECNQCEFVPKNVPDLKRHLFDHWTQKR